jgi:hypothetical protein
LVEKYTHSGWGQCTSGGMLQDRTNLLQGHTRKPFHELRYECAIFEVLKQCSYWHTSATEYPGTADALGITFNRWARGPVNHDGNGITGA